MKLSLNRAYDVLRREGYGYTIAYLLAIPALLFVQLIGCGKEPFDPSQHSIDRSYFFGELPADPPSYEEYLLTLKYVYEVMEVEVRDAEFA